MSRALCLFVFALTLPAGCRTLPAPVVKGTSSTLTIAAAGDLYLGGRFTDDPLRDARSLLDGELRFVNLEGPITDRGEEAGLDADGTPQGEHVRLKIARARAGWLKGRVDVVSIENNHIADQGEEGQTDTPGALRAQGIVAVDRSTPVTVTRGGTTVTWLARQFRPAAALDAETEIEEAVRRAKRAGPVIVSLHWGHTGMRIPEADQRRLAHRIVDAGASAILGHGPHSLQGIELYRDAVIAYSIGNLAFGCKCTTEEDAFVLRFALRPDGRVSKVEALPIVAGIQTAPLRSDDEGLYDLIATLSRDLGSEVARDGDRLRIRPLRH